MCLEGTDDGGAVDQGAGVAEVGLAAGVGLGGELGGLVPAQAVEVEDVDGAGVGQAAACAVLQVGAGQGTGAFEIDREAELVIAGVVGGVEEGGVVPGSAVEVVDPDEAAAALDGGADKERVALDRQRVAVAGAGGGGGLLQFGLEDPRGAVEAVDVDRAFAVVVDGADVMTGPRDFRCPSGPRC